MQGYLFSLSGSEIFKQFQKIFQAFDSNALQRYNTENLKQLFPKKELRSLSPNFHIHVCVSDQYTVFTGSVCQFCCRKYVDQSWEYINRSQTHKYGNWGWGSTIPILGLNKWDFRCSAWEILADSPFKSENFVSVPDWRGPRSRTWRPPWPPACDRTW